MPALRQALGFGGSDWSGLTGRTTAAVNTVLVIALWFGRPFVQVLSVLLAYRAAATCADRAPRRLPGRGLSDGWRSALALLCVRPGRSDNRNNSMNSRAPQAIRGLGFAPLGNIIGHARLVLLQSRTIAQLYVPRDAHIYAHIYAQGAPLRFPRRIE